MKNKNKVTLSSQKQQTLTIEAFISKLQKTINSEYVSPRYVYVLEHLYSDMYGEMCGEVYKREVYDSLKALVYRGLHNYEIPYQIANADEAAYYFDNSGSLCEAYFDHFKKKGERAAFDSKCAMDFASYMVCDILKKGKDYTLIYDGTIRIRRTTKKKLAKTAEKEVKKKKEVITEDNRL